MQKTYIGLLGAALLCALPTTSWAQGKAAAETNEKTPAAAETPTDGDGAEATADAPSESTGAEGAEDSLGDICKIDPEACPNLDFDKEAKRPLVEEVYAVQQRFVVKKGRFEVNPYWGLTLNDQFVGHPGPGLGLNYYVSEALAIGVNGNYYEPLNIDSKFNAQVRRAARVAVPLTEYQWSGALNFSYVPAQGKFAGFQDFIFHYDAYVVGGVGAISTRPIPIIDPDNRNFKFSTKLAFNAGIGLRIYLSRWFAAVLEVRDYTFNDQLENLEVASTPEAQRDESTWLGDKSLTWNVQAQAGVSFFLPPTFEYQLPK
ncbi:MAG: outer membrane beta-barrel domain-containing protein [Polyangiaceae bacterium]|nr:outer membrane beta-barrel domain-containing protein [Polyangiaceae bacterium]